MSNYPDVVALENARLEKLAEVAKRVMGDPGNNLTTDAEPEEKYYHSPKEALEAAKERRSVGGEKTPHVWSSAPRRKLRDILRQLLAIEQLEIEDASWLALTVRGRAERKQAMIQEALDLLHRFELDR